MTSCGRAASTWTRCLPTSALPRPHGSSSVTRTRWRADLQARVLDPGVDGLIVNLVANGHQPGVVDLAGRTLRKLVS